MTLTAASRSSKGGLSNNWGSSRVCAVVDDVYFFVYKSFCMRWLNWLAVVESSISMKKHAKRLFCKEFLNKSLYG